MAEHTTTTDNVDHVALTLDGSVPLPGGAMRWMPPEQAAAVRDRRPIAAGKLAAR